VRSREVKWSGSVIAIVRFSLGFSSPNRKANDHLQRLAYAKTLVEEFGEERGRKLILKTIKDYGSRCGEKAKNGGQDLQVWFAQADRMGGCRR